MDRFRYAYSVVFPDYWDMASESLTYLYSQRAPSVVADGEDLEEVIRFLNSPDWLRPLGILQEMYLSGELISWEATRLRVRVFGSTVEVEGNTVEIEESDSPKFLQLLASKLGIPVEGDFSYCIQESLFDNLKATGRSLFLPVTFEEGSTLRVRKAVWWTAFGLEHSSICRNRGAAGLVTFKMLEKYPNMERPSFCDLSKYTYRAVKVEWSENQVIDYLHEHWPAQVRVGYSIRRAVEALFKGKVKIPKDISVWDTSRILKELRRHGYLDSLK